jgi:hypothetical protein
VDLQHTLARDLSAWSDRNERIICVARDHLSVRATRATGKVARLGEGADNLLLEGSSSLYL